METTVCPWCQTEIVWDEELGPEEECPYCNNPLPLEGTVEVEEDTLKEEAKASDKSDSKTEPLEGYRTLNVTITEDEEELLHTESDQTNESDEDYSNLWEDETDTILPSVRALDAYEDSGLNMAKYGESVQSLLDHQEEVPECPNCREFMLHTGVLTVKTDQFVPVQSVLQPLEAPFGIQMYVCPACFTTTHSLATEDRLRMVKRLSSK
ncbi:hypothetical protein [Paenibacillus sp. 453mf]|uniref:hypothetical protein n=1 Tax=Paenibacillus sp. 453mf TaxID=1761874 RepID=UPI0008E98CE4|nr:hypothetical protein [Paenibacillus sp. 453mf]SFS43185.1 hypothetical protein SAMN04488601_101593 [Paenibacillus sp. 453mf]